MKCVVDGSVILAYVLGEEGGDVLAGDGGPFLLSAVNLTEVLTKVIERGMNPDDVVRALRLLPIEHVGHDRNDAMATARLRQPTRHLGLSLGDRACLALGQRHGVPVLTSDRDWARLDLGIDVRLIR